MKNRQIRVNERILLITKSEIRIFDYIRCIARENVKKRKKINQIELIRLYIAIFKKTTPPTPKKRAVWKENLIIYLDLLCEFQH